MDENEKGVQAYELTCTDCAFTTEFQGDIDGVLDVIEDHQDRMQNSPEDHFVDFQATSSSGTTSAED